ncbi:MAG: GxxExxY protein [Verrucomicrobiota bacterium]
MDTNISEMNLLYKDEVYEIINCAFEVLNYLGHGLHEKPYENALAIEFGLRGIPYQQQVEFPVSYKDQKVGLFIPDLITHNRIIIDTKVVERITDHERGQMINYLKLSQLKVGLLINFKKAKLEWERIVH